MKVWDATGREKTAAVGTTDHIIHRRFASPGAAEDQGLLSIDRSMTVRKMMVYLVGSSTPSVTWTVRHDPDRSVTGNEVVTSGTVTTTVTTADSITSFNDETIPSGSNIWFETTAQSGTVTELVLTIFLTED